MQESATLSFKGMLKSITSSGRSRGIKVELGENVSLDALEAFKDQVSWFEVRIVTPENDVVEVLMDSTTGEIL